MLMRRRNDRTLYLDVMNIRIDAILIILVFVPVAAVAYTLIG
jgi:hypothetical protein